ncbi:MAG: hypothetical protein GY849_02980 [Deltaproteobacteria bacterium]|nr:hypothetical protein [Deltaproteobacteria bacterium]
MLEYEKTWKFFKDEKEEMMRINKKIQGYHNMSHCHVGYNEDVPLHNQELNKIQEKLKMLSTETRQLELIFQDISSKYWEKYKENNKLK